jgi:hypothetical protein
MNRAARPTSGPLTVSADRVRRGSAYVMVLGVATLVAVIGMGVLLAARVGTRMTVDGNDAVEADALAASAVEQALTLINADPGWRSRYGSGKDNGPYPLGRGTITWKVVDEFDGDLANNANDVTRLYGTGSVGRARRVYSVLLQPAGPGLEVLQKPAHATTAFNVRISTVTINVTGGPLSTDGRFDANGNVNANVEASNTSGGGAINGSETIIIAHRPMPSPGVFDLYLRRATEIPWDQVSGTAGIRGALSAASNPYGSPNPDGIYHVRVPYKGVLKVDNARLQATLLVTADSGCKVKVGPSVLWEPPASDLPALIARGPDVYVTLDSSITGITELTAGQNLNPPAMPYNGSADTDLLDSYPAELKGLYHVMGKNATLEIGANLKCTGVLLTDGTIVAGDVSLPLVMNVSLALDKTLFSQPPAGYSTGEQMAPVDGTWERRPSP